MSASPNQPLAPPCARCLGRGYLFAPKGERSLAEPCECQIGCRACGGTGKVFTQRDGAVFAGGCRCKEIRRRVGLFNQARVPRHFCDKGFERFRVYEAGQEGALRAAKSFAENYPKGRKGICMWGKPGTGKTHLLCATLQHLTLERGVPCRYVEISLLFSEIKEAFQRNISALTALAPLADVEILAIDEIGKGRGTDFERETLDELLGRRYNADRTTLFATNCNARLRPRLDPGASGFASPLTVAREAVSDQELSERIGDRSFSRLAEMADILHVQGEDRRKPPG